MRRTDSLELWLNNLLGVEKFKPGLDRIRPIFAPYKNEFSKRKIKIITIGGTNGKGECAFALESLLTAKNFKVALWTSPHIKCVTERFKLNGQTIGATELLNIFYANQGYVGSLSYYEFLLKCFCDLVVEAAGIDIVIFEVGLGGRLDAVNLFDADLSAITSIGRDHQEYLGSSLKGILREKLGITRAHSPCFLNIEQAYLKQAAKIFCINNNVPHYLLDERVNVELRDYSDENRFLSSMICAAVCKQEHSADLAKKDLSFLTDQTYLGRFEKKAFHSSELVFNGAHNVDGMRKMSELLLKRKEFFDEVIVAPSKRNEKDLKAFIEVLKARKCLYNKLVLTTFDDHPRSSTKDVLVELKSGLEVVSWKDELLKQEKEGKRILITGSYYFIGEVQKFIDS